MHWRIRDPLLKPLMGSGLIEVESIRASGGGGVASHGRSDSDPGMLASRFPESVRHLAFARRGSDTGFEAL